MGDYDYMGKFDGDKKSLKRKGRNKERQEIEEGVEEYEDGEDNWRFVFTIDEYYDGDIKEYEDEVWRDWKESTRKESKKS